MLSALAALLLVSLNLRIAIAAVSPVLDAIRADLGLSRGAAGLLTTLPVLCFGALAPVVAASGRRFGNEVTLGASMGCLVVGICVRSAGGTPYLVAGTLLLGAGIAAGNVLVPALVKADLAEVAGTAMALYTTCLNGGAAIAAAGTAWLFEAGWSWRWALAAGVVPAVVGLVAFVWWDLRTRGKRHRTPVGGDGLPAALPSVRVWRSATAWQLALFFGGQSLLFYSLLAWLPVLLQDHGVPLPVSGGMVSLFSLLGIVGALAVPPLAVRNADQRPLACGCGAGWLAGLLGLWLAPSAYVVWTVVLGLAQGAGIAVALTLIVLRARDGAVARDLSGMVQMAGYLLAAVGPLGAGALRDAAGDWSAALAMLAAVSVLMTGSGVGAGRPRQVG